MLTNIAGSDNEGSSEALFSNEIHMLMIELIRTEQAKDDHETAIWYLGNVAHDSD